MQIPDKEQNILPWIGRTGKMLSNYAVDKFKQHGFDLTMEQFVILKILNYQDGMTQNDLATCSEKHKATLTRALAALEKRNLVARIPDKQDGRVNHIYLTTQGRKYFQTTLPVLEEIMKEIQEGLTDAEIVALIKILKKVQANLTK